MKTAARTKVDTELRDEWLSSLDELKNQIKTWIHGELGWSMEEVGTKEIEEPPLSLYTVRLFEIKTSQGQARLEPIARNYPGRGIVELYAWPTLRRVRLIQYEDNNWKVLTDSGIYLRAEWNSANAIALVQDLIAAG